MITIFNFDRPILNSIILNIILIGLVIFLKPKIAENYNKKYLFFIVLITSVISYYFFMIILWFKN